MDLSSTAYKSRKMYFNLNLLSERLYKVCIAIYFANFILYVELYLVMLGIWEIFSKKSENSIYSEIRLVDIVI